MLVGQGLYKSLTAYIEFLCGLIQFIQHGLSEIHIDTLNRRHYLALVGEIGGYVFSPIRQSCDRFS